MHKFLRLEKLFQSTGTQLTVEGQQRSRDEIIANLQVTQQIEEKQLATAMQIKVREINVVITEQEKIEKEGSPEWQRLMELTKIGLLPEPLPPAGTTNNLNRRRRSTLWKLVKRGWR